MLDNVVDYVRQGKPWAHFTTEAVMGASITTEAVTTEAVTATTAQDGCGFDIVVKRTKPAIKYGEQIKASALYKSMHACKREGERKPNSCDRVR